MGSLRARVLPTTLAIALGSALVAPAHAANKPITGKLSKTGYTVVALGANGKARVVKASGRAFRLIPPAGTVSLHLRDAKGVYAGPIVVGAKTPTKAIVGVKAGAALGTISVRTGYARPKAAISRRLLNPAWTARAKKGAPIGAGVFGRVRSAAKGPSGAGRDQDADGLPGAFDVDDDGDLVLDNFERRSGGSLRARAAADPPMNPPPMNPAAPRPGAASGFRIFSNFKLDLAQSLNANAAAVTDAQIDAAMASAQTLAIQVAPGSVELDCGGLSYCSLGGTGTALEGARPFPAAFDGDGDGFGLLAAGPTGDFQLRTGAKAADIGSGDAFVQRITSDGAETQLPGILNYAFSTTPALTSWRSGDASGSITYPAAVGTPGTPGNAIPVAGAGDAIVSMTFWRPQRRPIAGSGEGGDWVDIGRLKYTADVPNAPQGTGAGPGPGPGNCPANSYSSMSSTLSAGGDGVVDGAGDQASSAANTLTFSVNLTQCLAKAGLGWAPGQVLQVDIQARSEFGDNAAQKISFVRG